MRIIFKMLQRVTFENKNKNSSNPIERTLTDLDINQLKTKLNKTIDRVNSTITDEQGNYLNYYNKEETQNLIDKQVEQLSDKILDETTSSVINSIIPSSYFNQLNNKLSCLINKIEKIN